VQGVCNCFGNWVGPECNIVAVDSTASISNQTGVVLFAPQTNASNTTTNAMFAIGIIQIQEIAPDQTLPALNTSTSLVLDNTTQYEDAIRDMLLMQHSAMVQLFK